MKAVHVVTGENRRLIVADDTDTVYLFDRDICISTKEAIRNPSSAHTTFKKVNGLIQCAPLAIGPTNVPSLVCQTRNPNVLIGGLGLGGAAEQLLRLYSSKVTSVDILKPMIETYRSFKTLYKFDMPRQALSTHKVIHGDFFKTLSKNKVPPQGYWDIVFFDCYLGDDGPNTTKRISDEDFHSDLLKLKAKTLVFNMCVLDSSEEQEWVDLQNILSQKFFTSVIECPTYLSMPKQCALVASKNKVDITACHPALQKYVKRCKVLS